MTQDTGSLLSRNRAEEFGPDVWEHFVIPPYFGKVDLRTAGKPRVIIGGRGCGKTMVLRYFSHHSTFSRKRAVVPDSAINAIGLYLRVDQQFCFLMAERGESSDYWASVFDHYLALTVGAELLDSLSNIESSALSASIKPNLGKLRFTSPIDSTSCTVAEIRKLFDDQLWKFEIWLKNVKSVPAPLFLPARRLVERLIKELVAQHSAFKDTTFHVYIDEYENLRQEQKRVINSALKFSVPPLLFHLAMKRNSFDVRGTLTSETLSDIHDYRKIDLEEEMQPRAFEVFAAEVLLNELAKAGKIDVPEISSLIKDETRLAERQTVEYIQKVTSRVRELFPARTDIQVAHTLILDETLKRKVIESIESGIQGRSNIPAEQFVPEGSPEVAIVNSALLHRKRITPESLLTEMTKYCGSDKRTVASPYNDWIHNNLFGCMLYYYSIYKKPCPLYAGFSTFCTLSNMNMRHFLELCNKSLGLEWEADMEKLHTISVEVQSEAARVASKILLEEVRSFGPLGEQLYTFAMRLGRLLKLSGARPSQSEPEMTQFSIVGGDQPLSEDDIRFIKEATKYSVLFESEDTKRKDPTAPSAHDYQLNPIYSPFFYISYRKKRKLEIELSEFQVMYRGGFDQFKTVLNAYAKKWELSGDPYTTDMFREGF